MQRAGLAFLMLYAALGLALSLCVHVMSFFGPPPGGDILFFGLHLGIFPLWVCVIFLASRMSGGSIFGGGGRVTWKALLARAPPVLRYMTVGFFLYAIFNFVTFALSVVSEPQTPHGAPPPEAWRGFSGHWMAFYSAGLTIAATAYLRGVEPPGAKCPNGHAVGAGDQFCPRCGARTRAARI